MIFSYTASVFTDKASLREGTNEITLSKDAMNLFKTKTNKNDCSAYIKVIFIKFVSKYYK